jgi:hypothetical protein
MNPGDPRTLDAYMYSSDNPVLYTDASGLSPCSGLSAENEVRCMAAYNKGSGYKAPTPGKHTVPKRKTPKGIGKGPSSSGGVLDRIKSGANGLKDAASDAVQDIGTSVSDGLSRAQDLASSAGSAITSGASSAWDWTEDHAKQAWHATEDWWIEHGDEVLVGIAIVGTAICIVGSAGTLTAACVVGGVTLTATNIVDGVKYRDMSVGEAVTVGNVGLATAAFGGMDIGAELNLAQRVLFGTHTQGVLTAVSVGI